MNETMMQRAERFYRVMSAGRTYATYPDWEDLEDEDREDVVRGLEAVRPEADAEIKRLRAALEQIEKGEGRYSRDPLTHASNTIEDMQRIAREALGAAAPHAEANTCT